MSDESRKKLLKSILCTGNMLEENYVREVKVKGEKK